ERKGSRFGGSACLRTAEASSCEGKAQQAHDEEQGARGGGMRGAHSATATGLRIVVVRSGASVLTAAVALTAVVDGTTAVAVASRVAGSAGAGAAGATAARRVV